MTESLVEHAPPTPPRRVVRELALAYLAATAAAAALYRVALLRSYYSAILAALLLYLPVWILRDRPLSAFGLTHRPLARNLALLAGALVVVFPIFLFGYLFWERIACGLAWLRPLANGPCGTGSVWSHFVPRLPVDFLELALAQLVVVALPEEFFFRGYLQGRLAEVWPSMRQRTGAGAVPWGPVVVASALFALCHLAVQWNAATLAVFFPGLVFGWMRARTGSVLPGTLFHALCNLYIETLHRSFFG